MPEHERRLPFNPPLRTDDPAEGKPLPPMPYDAYPPGAKELPEPVMQRETTAMGEPLWSGETKARKGFGPDETSFIQAQLEVPAGTRVAVILIPPPTPGAEDR